MEEDYEKRFQQISDKLFRNSPKSKPNSRNNSSLGVQKLISKKRPSTYASSSGKVVEELGSSSSIEEPSCRPWNRDDLFKRLATFKSMTWFAKPQVVSPLNCARRGWVNVDADTIGCESCGARLLFSTSSALSQQQVEKAAKVFSLKLESGHKLLCPWINNACTEELARFPIASHANLIEDYKKRFFALSKLIALPTISPAAIDKMRSPELDQYLGEFSVSGYKETIENSGTELSEEVPESISSYYQAQKLISLCGWEPHVLPYTVDFKDGQNQSIKDGNVRFMNTKKQKINIHSLCTEGSVASAELQFDPSSVVLDCNLCGASVGLWAFFTVPRPVEYLRFIGLTEVNDKNVSVHDEVCAQEVSPGSQICTGIKDGVHNTVRTPSTPLGSSIAGGPPPLMLNYSANISLPVVGQRLRARFMAESEDHSAVQKPSQVEDQQMAPENSNVTTEEDFATSGQDFIKDPLDVPEDYTSTSGGRRESSGEKVVEAKNYQHGSSKSIYQGPDKNLPTFSKSREFDPIKQHRHFCPWVVSTGKSDPGWQQTVSALKGHKKFSSWNSVASSSSIEVDDPIASVRMLFASPNEKGRKVAGGSNV